MATPNKLRPVSAFRRVMFYSAYAIPAMCILAAAILVFNSMIHERGLATKLLRNTIRNTSHLLDKRDLRGVIESASNSLDFVYFQIDMKDSKQIIGKKSWLSVCATEEIMDIRLELCRDTNDVIIYIFIVLFFCASLGLALGIILRRLERAILKDINLAIWDFQKKQPYVGDIETALIKLRDLAKGHRLAMEDKILLVKAEERLNLQRQLLHDLKSPIMALDIVATAGSTDVASLKSLVTQAVGRLNSLVKKLKDGPVLESESFSMLELNKTLEIAEHLISSGGMVFKVSPFRDVKVLGSEEQVARIVDNLIKNSFEALLNTQTELALCQIEHNSMGAYELITISDNGPGFDSDVLLQIEAGVAATGKSDGEGIGLINARAYLRMNQGDMKISSRPGQTDITLYLRRVES